MTMDARILKLASTSHTVLITGRTGTGKSHLAREIHNASPRRAGRFVAINLATLSENLIESELFGHEKGAFSGADLKRTGKLETAGGGTAFLDEIGELPLRLQTKLLEALNSHTISPVGSNREIQLNIRVIAATNRDLRSMVATGEFREDLYYRLNTFQVSLPNLADEPDRVLSLAARFAAESAEKQGKTFSGMSVSLVNELKRYQWPGNVRELKNAMEYCVAMGESGSLTPGDLPSYLNDSDTESAHEASTIYPTDYREAKCSFEKKYFSEILKRFGGRINHTARETGLSKVTLIEKIRRYQIDINLIKYGAYASQERI